LYSIELAYLIAVVEQCGRNLLRPPPRLRLLAFPHLLDVLKLEYHAVFHHASFSSHFLNIFFFPI